MYLPACSHTCVRAKHGRSSPSTRPRSRSALAALILTAAAAFDSVVSTNKGIDRRLPLYARPANPQLTTPSAAAVLDEVLPPLVVSPDEQARTRACLLGLLAEETSPEKVLQLASTLAELAPDAEERAEALRALLKARPRSSGSGDDRNPARTIMRLATTTAEKDQARKSVLELLPNEAADGALALAEALAQMTPTAPQRAQALHVLLGAKSAGILPIARLGDLVNLIEQLTITVDERAQAREALLKSLAGETGALKAAYFLAPALSGLTPSAGDECRARESLLRLLTAGGQENAAGLAVAVALLSPSAPEQAQVRDTLLRFIADQAEEYLWSDRERVLSLFAPTLSDLARIENRPRPSPPELLAAVRKNSRLSDWIAALRQLN
jgi:hypothetical protein